VLSKLFRRLMIEKLVAAHAAGQLAFYGARAALVDATAFSGLRKPIAIQAAISLTFAFGEGSRALI
jgi:hypothetical protein